MIFVDGEKIWLKRTRFVAIEIPKNGVSFSSRSKFQILVYSERYKSYFKTRRDGEREYDCYDTQGTSGGRKISVLIDRFV